MHEHFSVTVVHHRHKLLSLSHMRRRGVQPQTPERPLQGEWRFPQTPFRHPASLKKLRVLGVFEERTKVKGLVLIGVNEANMTQNGGKPLRVECLPASRGHAASVVVAQDYEVYVLPETFPSHKVPGNAQHEPNRHTVEQVGGNNARQH
jgi:hypothetical protein